MIMETKKFKQVPSINRIGGHNPNIPPPVIVSRGIRRQGNGRKIPSAMRNDSRTIGAGESINWDEVYLSSRMNNIVRA